MVLGCAADENNQCRCDIQCNDPTGEGCDVSTSGRFADCGTLGEACDNITYNQCGVGDAGECDLPDRRRASWSAVQAYARSAVIGPSTALGEGYCGHSDAEWRSLIADALRHIAENADLLEYAWCLLPDDLRDAGTMARCGALVERLVDVLTGIDLTQVRGHPDGLPCIAVVTEQGLATMSAIGQGWGEEHFGALWAESAGEPTRLDGADRDWLEDYLGLGCEHVTGSDAGYVPGTSIVDAAGKSCADGTVVLFSNADAVARRVLGGQADSIELAAAMVHEILHQCGGDETPHAGEIQTPEQACRDVPYRLSNTWMRLVRDRSG